MSILFLDKDLNWLPNHQFFRKYLNDLMQLKAENFRELREQVSYVLESYSYYLDYEEASNERLTVLLKATEGIIDTTKESSWDDLWLKDLYVKQLHMLRNNIIEQIGRLGNR